MAEQQEPRGWQEALRRIEAVRQLGAFELDLSDLKLTTLPDCLAQLTNLQSLDLDRNQISTIPNVLAHLSSLQHLSLQMNQISNIPDSLAQLTNLITLLLNGNQIVATPDSLAQLTKFAGTFAPMEPDQFHSRLLDSAYQSAMVVPRWEPDQHHS